MDREPDLEIAAQAGTVAEGRRKMAEGGIDAAIVDVPLSDEYGIELVRELHEANPSIPVLVLTGAQDRENHQRLLGAGASEVLSKEIPFEEVLAAVRRLSEAGAETSVIRAIFAYEDTHLAYRDVLVSVVRSLRPHIAVTIAGLRTLESEVKRLNPHLVVSSRPNMVDPGNRAAWYKLAHEPDEPSEVCLNGRRSGSDNPGLEELLEIIDEVERLVQTGHEPGGC